MKRGFCALGCVCALFAVATTASASAAPSRNSGGWVLGGTAVWKTHAGDNPGNPNYGIVTTSSGAGTYTSGTYGEADLAPPALPTAQPSQITALSYDFNAAQTGPSGGSPRLVVCFSDSTPAGSCNDNAELGPNTWTANTWVHVDGFSSDANSIWVNNGQGGTCPYEYNTTWSAIVSCHSGQTIVEVRVVNDSGWEYPATSSEQITLDNLTVNNAIATGP